MMGRSRRTVTGLVAGLLATAMLPMTAIPAAATAPQNPVSQSSAPPIDVQILALTDLHGYLAPATDAANNSITDAAGTNHLVGGAAYLATHLDQASAGQQNSIRVANGDSFTGWQWQVTMTRDEPTVEVLNDLGIEVSSVGNHELDISLPFLRDHMVDGVCAPQWDAEGCTPLSDGSAFGGTDFPFLAANLTVDGTDEQPFASSYVREVTGADGATAEVGFIGVTTPAVERIFASYQVGALVAAEMQTAVDAEAQRLSDAGVETIIVLAHEGAGTTGTFDQCANVDGPVIDLAREASPLVDAFVGGHWHSAFDCDVAGPDGADRPVISPGHHGRLFGDIRLQIDPATGNALNVSATNVPVTRTVPANADITATVNYWHGIAGALWARPTGAVTADITTTLDATGESAMKNLVADAYRDTAAEIVDEPVQIGIAEPYQARGNILFATGTNPADAPGTVLFGEAWAVQGRGSSVVVGALSGHQILTALEQQWRLNADGTEGHVPLGLSGLQVVANPTQQIGSRIKSVLVGQQKLKPNHTYLVAMSSRLALGMDGFPALTDPVDPARSDMDYFAFTDWWRTAGTVSPPATDRVEYRCGALWEKSGWPVNRPQVPGLPCT